MQKVQNLLTISLIVDHLLHLQNFNILIINYLNCNTPL